MELVGHRDAVSCVTVSPNGRIISGSEDNTVIIWSQKGSKLKVCHGHSDGVFCIAMCPDGAFVTGSYDWTLIHWNAEGEVIRVLGGPPYSEGHTRDITCVTVSRPGTFPFTCASCRRKNAGTVALTRAPVRCMGCQAEASPPLNNDDYWIVSGSLDEKCVMWYCDERVKSRELLGHTGGVMSVATLIDGRIISAGKDKKVFIWNSSDGSVDYICKCHQGPIYCLAVLPNERFVSGSADGTLALWNSDGSLARVQRGHNSPVIHAVLQKDVLVSSAKDCSILVWGMDGQLLSRGSGAENGGVMISLVAGPDMLASGSVDGTVCVWSKDMKPKQVLQGHRGPVSAVAVGPDGQVVSTSKDLSVRVW